MSSLLKDASDTVRARCRLDVEAWNRKPITFEKRVHQSLNGDCLPVSRWACAVIEVNFQLQARQCQGLQGVKTEGN